MILGVTGNFCAGKDTLAGYIERKSFAHISLSDIIREEIRSRGRRVTLRSLTEVGNELRAECGASVLAQRALERMKASRHYVVTSIRHPAEVERFRRRKDFALVWVDASLRVRFERSRARNRSGDLTTFEEFRRAEAQQQKSEDPAAQQLRSCRRLADYVVKNDSDLETLYRRANGLLRRFFRDFYPPRPTWDEYFMSIAEVAATRSNCLKRHTGAIIVRDRQIISTGYNGTPKGITNCSEGGCPRCNSFEDSGKRLDECICVHAEENAIVQAAYHGTRIKDSTLYTTLCPCSYCAKSIINAGIRKVVYREEYAMDEVTQRLFEEAKVEVALLPESKRQE